MKIYKLLFLLSFGVIACNDNNNPGLEFAPNMYNSEAYEPLTQWRPNDVNAHKMNMRMPPHGAIPRRNYKTKFVQSDSTVINDLMIYDYGKNDLELAAANLKNPIPWSEQSEKEGKALYNIYCQPCHGATGAGDGKVGKKYAGVPNYTSDALKNITAGHIFHVITYGKGRMWPYEAQLNPEERWKVVQYVQRLQLGN